MENQRLKLCKYCGRMLPTDMFYKNKSYKCKECSKKYQKIYYHERHGKKSAKAEERPKAKYGEALENERCKKCIYRTPFEKVGWACYYIMHTGHRRPCEPGDKCTEFTEGRPLRPPKE